MRRLCFLSLVLGLAGRLHASDAIAEPGGGRSATIAQPHVTAELISETTTLHPGRPFAVALHLHMDPGWHTYWVNPGDAGLATTIKWTLPPGFSAGPIEWPTPERHAMGPLTTYGYGGDVYLLTTITPASAVAQPVRPPEIKAHAAWLVCQEECIPGKADLAITLQTNVGGKESLPEPARSAFFAGARDRLPVPNTRWDVAGAYQQAGSTSVFVLQLKEKTHGAAPPSIDHLQFLAEQSNVIAVKNAISPAVSTVEGVVTLEESLRQNGEKPATLSGLLISDQSLIGASKAVTVPPFPVARLAATAPAPAPPPPAKAPEPWLPAILGLAFLGGLVLNLMPCVLPVLSLKVFSLIRHAGGNAGGAWKQGVAFTAGVVISFWILAGLLIALEAAGRHLGWGFQMQSPGFVLALTFLFFLLALNLFGVFELGASLVGLDAKAASHLGGLASSFANGALATLAATPCTAPFMGSAVGFAAQQPAAISLLVFTCLGLGMAAPYLALTLFPAALSLAPKPGAWMEALRQFMGFLLMGTVIFFVYVFAALVGQESVPMLLGALLLAALAAWIFGRGTPPVHATVTRVVSTVAALVLLGAAVAEGAWLAAHHAAQDDWQPYSPAAVRQALEAGRPVFVDFTAAWCLSCKVNERVALDIDSTQKLFAQKHVALFRGDWTHGDPQISETLRDFNRDGVPLYLLYSPKNPQAPLVLPAVLTPGLVHDALQKLP